jgi:hypothetical protein
MRDQLGSPWFLGALLACALLTRPSALERAELSWSPENPVQGKLFVVHADVGTERPSGLTGTFGGEPLHFRGGRDGRWWALAAVPIESTGQLEIAVDVSWAGRAPESLRRMVTVAPGRYAMERLTVAPRYTELSEELRRRTEAESERAMAVARGAHRTTLLWASDSLARPRPTRITSGFGNGREFNGQVESRHMGTDFQGAVGAPVLAAATGVVALVDQFYLGGNVIYIDHGGGLSTGYLHLSETRVAAGDTVQAGQRIGSVGATGRVTGPHLHFIVRYGGITVDPLSLLELELPADGDATARVTSSDSPS